MKVLRSGVLMLALAIAAAACGGGDDAGKRSGARGDSAGAAAGMPAGGQPVTDPGAVPGTAPPPGDPELDAAPAPTGGYGGGQRQSYADCMRQVSDALGTPDVKRQMEAACKRLPDAPK
jgi:hypothetical protein